MDGEITMLPDDLPEDMPSFVARFGTDEQCREYLFKARWPDGFRCSEPVREVAEPVQQVGG